MKSKIVTGPRARADARDIWRHTAAEHGQDVADAYIHGLDKAMQLVCEFPEVGSDCSAVRKGYRRILSGSHLIYYISNKADIYVIRILHERQDPGTNLR